MCKDTLLRTTDSWMDSPAMLRLAHHSPTDNVHSLSTLFEAALQEFVRLAGGWVVRGPNRRPAYESQQVRRARATLRLLGNCMAALHQESGIGSFSHKLLGLLEDLLRRAESSESVLVARSWAFDLI